MADGRPSGSSFYWALRLMPRERREGMYALYRYCRALDDIADGDEAAEEKLSRLDDWRRGIDRLFAGRDPDLAELRPLTGAVRRFALERAPLEAVIDGMEMDVRGYMVAPPAAVLERYCYCAAGAVGLSSIRIFGAGAEADTFARALGEAMQLTNILRDLHEDAARGRLYLPREILESCGVRLANPAAVLSDPGVGAACERLAEFADVRYRQARAALPADPRPLRPAMVMMSVYVRLMARLRRSGWPPAVGTRVPDAERLWIALRHLGPAATWPSYT